MVANAQGVGDDCERRVYCPARYEEAAIHDVEVGIVDVPRPGGADHFLAYALQSRSRCFVIIMPTIAVILFLHRRMTADVTVAGV